MRVTYIDNLSTGLDSLAQTEEDNEPGEGEGEGQVVLKSVQVSEVCQSRAETKDVLLPELLGTALQPGAVVSKEGGAPGK